VQDDAHIYCTKAQIEDEVIAMIDFINHTYKTFGLEYTVRLSTRPTKAMGSEADWKEAENKLKNALKKSKLKYTIDEGEGAFYGPKIDFHVPDALGRLWQCGTIQLDFQLPEKFDLEYAGKDNKRHRPAVLHRTIVGSVERFLALLVERYGGAFPLWLAPVQVKLISFTDEFIPYAKKVEKEMREAGLRVEIDYRQESVPKKVRDAEVAKVNYIIVIGQKEKKAGTVAVRQRGQKSVKFGVKTKAFINQVLKEVETKK